MKIKNDAWQLALLVVHMSLIVVVFVSVALFAEQIGEILEPILSALVPK